MRNKHTPKRVVDALRKKASKTQYAIMVKEFDNWRTLEVFPLEAERDVYYASLVMHNPDLEMRKVNL